MQLCTCDASTASTRLPLPAGKHEALVELLLRYGADPFSENPSGRTPMDLALDARCVALLRMLERHALFSGNVSMKARTPPRTAMLARAHMLAAPRIVAALHSFYLQAPST